MKDQDLVIKAADVFLAWPEWVEVILFNTLTNEFHMSATTKNEFNMNCAKGLTDRKVWQIVMNREQHIAEIDGDKKWVPGVGQECEANLIGEPTFLCMPNAIVKDKIWFTEVREGKKDRDFVYKLNELDFRPLKTQAEKDTEAAYELVKDAVDLYQACETLIEAGYKK